MRGKGNDVVRRRLTFVIGVGLVLAALTVSTALGGAKFLTSKKALNLFAKKTDVYTKAESDSAFSKKGEAYTKGEADAKFSPLSHTTSLVVSNANWVSAGGTGVVTYQGQDTSLTAPGMAADQQFIAALTLPQAIAGQTVKITGFELCYVASASALLDRVFMQKNNNVITGSISGASSQPIDDDMDRTDSACRTYTPPAPQPIGANDTAQILVRIDYSMATTLTIKRLRVDLST